MILQDWSFMYGLFAGLGLYALFKRLQEKTVKQKEKPNDLDCLFFSPESFNMTCYENNTDQYCSILSCTSCNFKKLFSEINKTKKTLDICMYLITSNKLTNLVLKLFERGVFVRILADKQMSGEAQSSKVLDFIKQHVPIKLIDTGETMHNKFVIIDKKVLITGSFNWTKQAMFYNYENGIVVRNEEIVQKYCDYFQNIWLSSNKN